ncbi:hypothetical protein KKC1_05350 [Calderihabitans maritimus]|uniref:Uncharacterized protein n=1 Tax=Calderihabitans maritimus TaxID=1246530 RepID=A0A1Z5HPD2_9FIRM|nr:hypothetical protein KKC1_05350 [Calderihabitans maritimus]
MIQKAEFLLSSQAKVKASYKRGGRRKLADNRKLS